MIDLSEFSAISLNQLNTQANLMDRDEQKYLLHYQNLPELLDALRSEFAVLEIAGNSIFSYDNIYMDTKDLRCYHDHNQSKSQRFKVRTRHYQDSGLHYFEFKHKNKGHMSKFRYEIDHSQHGVMNTAGYSFIEDIYQSLFDTELTSFIFPSLTTQYQRITLCHKTKPEKITIDFALKVLDNRSKKGGKFTLHNVVIIESKTNEDFSVGQEILEANNAISVETCSKYCVGHNLLGNVAENHHFTKTLSIITDLMEGGKTFSRKKLIQKIERAL